MRERKPPTRLNERAKSPVVLVRIRPDELTPADGRENWHVDGMVVYSKICTHVGSPVSLHERTTHHPLRHGHQATFDLADNGAVMFGPATQWLPQRPLAVDDDGFLVTQAPLPRRSGRAIGSAKHDQHRPNSYEAEPQLGSEASRNGG